MLPGKTYLTRRSSETNRCCEALRSSPDKVVWDSQASHSHIVDRVTTVILPWPGMREKVLCHHRCGLRSNCTRYVIGWQVRVGLACYHTPNDSWVIVVLASAVLEAFPKVLWVHCIAVVFEAIFVKRFPSHEAELRSFMDCLRHEPFPSCLP